MKRFQIFTYIMIVLLLMVNIGLSVQNVWIAKSISATSEQIKRDVDRLKKSSKEVQEEDNYWDALRGAQSYAY